MCLVNRMYGCVHCSDKVSIFCLILITFTTHYTISHSGLHNDVTMLLIHNELFSLHVTNYLLILFGVWTDSLLV